MVAGVVGGCVAVTFTAGLLLAWWYRGRRGSRPSTRRYNSVYVEGVEPPLPQMDSDSEDTELLSQDVYHDDTDTE